MSQPFLFFHLLGLSIVSSRFDFFVHTVFFTKKNKKGTKLILPTTLNEISHAFFSFRSREKLQKFDYLVMDGMSLVFLSKVAGFFSERIYGPDLMRAVIRSDEKNTFKHFFYGNTQSTLKSLQKKLKKYNPGIKIVGSFSPPFRPMSLSEKKKAFQRIKKRKPDIVWVSLGGMKQVEAALELKKNLSPLYIIPVGAAFDFLSGHKPQASILVQRMGLEWLFRLFSEPKRLWKRYLLQIPIFLVLFILEVVKMLLFASFSLVKTKNSKNPS